MASIEEVALGISVANDHASAALSAAHQAWSEIQTATGALMHATEGSPQADVSRAVGLFIQASTDLEEIQARISGGISEADAVRGRL